LQDVGASVDLLLEEFCGSAEVRYTYLYILTHTHAHMYSGVLKEKRVRRE
jgi:hypothetical protein